MSLKGITGADISSYEELEKRVQNIKKITNIPIVVGFGIKINKLRKICLIFQMVLL